MKSKTLIMFLSKWYFLFRKPLLIVYLLFHCAFVDLNAQDNPIVISGSRFASDLIRDWIQTYHASKPDVKFELEDKGSGEYSEADIVVYGHQPSERELGDRQYFSVCRYAIFPIANSTSGFAATYGLKGLIRSEIEKVFFYDPLSKLEASPLKTAFHLYSRVQKASSPIVFSEWYGYRQPDIQARLISGTDEHLIQAVLRDSIGVSFVPFPILVDRNSKSIRSGLKIIPVDINGNGKISADEKSLTNISEVLKQFETGSSVNLPISNIWLGISKKGANSQVLHFLSWVLENGEHSLAAFGFLPLPESIKSKELASVSQFLD